MFGLKYTLSFVAKFDWLGEIREGNRRRCKSRHKYLITSFGYNVTVDKM